MSKNEKKLNKQNKGSVLVAVLLILFMIAVISTALIKRSLVSTNISIETRKTSVEYQGADALMEQILLAINKIENPTVANVARIDEITINNICNCATDSSYCVDDLSTHGSLLISDNFCTIHEIEFYDIAGDTITNYEITIDELSRIKINSDDESSVKRAIQANIPKRIVFPPEPSIQSFDCTDPSSDCDTNYILGGCGSKCYKISFAYLTNDIDKLAGINILVDQSSSGKKWFNFDKADAISDFKELVCDTSEFECYFYIGSETENIDGSTLNEDGALSFRLRANSSFQLDSLDVDVSNPDGDPEFDFTP